jgi:hypothetical protein
VGKKKNKDLREYSNTAVELSREKRFLISDGIDESLAEDMTRCKVKRKVNRKEE